MIYADNKSLFFLNKSSSSQSKITYHKVGIKENSYVQLSSKEYLKLQNQPVNRLLRLILSYLAIQGFQSYPLINKNYQEVI